MKTKLAILILMILGFIAESAFANDYSATIRGKSDTVVTKQSITLSDIADIESKNDEAILSLSKIAIMNSPLPGKSVSLNAQKILEILKINGVDTNKVGYVFYPSMNIKRASRSVTEAEARAAIEDLVSQESEDSKISNIYIPREALVFTGSTNVTANLKSKGTNSRIYSLNFTNSESEKISIDIKAEIDSWKEVPIANRSILAGSIIGALDFGLARMNTKELPKDIAFNPQELIGKKIQRNINSGEPFKMPSLGSVPVIKSGSRVTIVFNSGLLEATARGIATQDGQQGDIIEVKNDTSKNIVIGRVKDRSTVEVLE